MKHIKSLKSFSKVAAVTMAFVVTVTGISLGGGQSASASSGGIRIHNNCGSTRVFGYNYHNSSPGTGSYITVANRSTYTLNTGGGIFRVELPRGIFNTFVYNGSWNTLNMC